MRYIRQLVYTLVDLPTGHGKVSVVLVTSTVTGTVWDPRLPSDSQFTAEIT